MTATIVNTSTGGYTSNTSGSVSIASTTAGNVLFVIVHRYGNGSINTPTASGVTFQNAGSNVTGSIYLDMWIGSVGAGVTSVGLSSAVTMDVAVTVLEISGVLYNQKVSWLASSGYNSGTGTTPNPGLANNLPDYTENLGIVVVSYATAASVTSSPTGYTQASNLTYGNAEGWVGYDTDNPGTSTSWTLSQSVDYTSCRLYIRTSGRILYPDSSTNNAFDAGAYDAEKNATWTGPNAGSVAFTNIAKGSYVTMTWFASNSPAHNSTDWPTTDGSISLDITTATAMGTQGGQTRAFRVVQDGSGFRTNNASYWYASAFDISTTGIKVFTANASAINDDVSRSADDALVLYFLATQSGSHTTGAITIDDSDSYFYHPGLVKPSSFIPSRPRTIPGVAVSQSSRW